MRKRTLAREFAMKALYQSDIRGTLSDQDLENIVKTEDLGRMPDFGRQLATGSFASREEIDEIIRRVATNWRIDRMPVVDRNILRLATYELLYISDTPPKVIINEAIELAKKYGTGDSPTFVNGVLDKVYSIYAKPRRTSTDNPEEIERISMTKIQNIVADPLAKADLHVHSTASDGSLAPLDLLHRARAQGLRAIAITDHDSIDAVAEATIEAQKMDIYLVPAVELTSYTHPEDEKRQHELHILGYFINADDIEFKEELTRLRRIRTERVYKIAAALDTIGIDIDAETIIQNTNGSVGRVHVAQELMRKGICSSLPEAFQKYIGAGKPAYVPKEQLTPKVAIQLIHNAGGCAVIAHPGVTEGLDDTWEELVEAGIDGIEVHYPAHSPEEEAKWLDMARRLDLLVTGGSDFHGEARPDVEIGQETVSMVEVHNLLERANERRCAPLSVDKTTS